MATLADGGRIDGEAVGVEIARLQAAGRGGGVGVGVGGVGVGGVGGVGGGWVDADDGLARLLGERADELDRFDRVQLADVVAVCTTAPSLSAAGRVLFARSLASRTTKNDADRLRKYLVRFGIDFETIRR
jgi:transcriptional regulatory protein RtcR